MGRLNLTGVNRKYFFMYFRILRNDTRRKCVDNVGVIYISIHYRLGTLPPLMVWKPHRAWSFLKLSSRKPFRFIKQIISKDKCSCIFSRQIEAFVYKSHIPGNLPTFFIFSLITLKYSRRNIIIVFSLYNCRSSWAPDNWSFWRSNTYWLWCLIFNNAFHDKSYYFTDASGCEMSI